MSARITPLRLEAFEHLPKHARRCVFWEVDPATLSNQDHLADPEFKGSLALDGDAGVGLLRSGRNEIPDERRRAKQVLDGALRAAGGGAAGAPVSHRTGSRDAVLLTSMGVERGQATDDLPHSLIARVIDEMVRRGVRALEAFGRTEGGRRIAGPRAVDPDVRPVLEALGDCSVDHCIISADFLKDVGFVVVAPHPYFPRLRLELDKGLGWKAEVEAALERLLANAQLEVPVGGRVAAVERQRLKNRRACWSVRPTTRGRVTRRR